MIAGVVMRLLEGVNYILLSRRCDVDVNEWEDSKDKEINNPKGA